MTIQISNDEVVEILREYIEQNFSKSINGDPIFMKHYPHARDAEVCERFDYVAMEVN